MQIIVAIGIGLGFRVHNAVTARRQHLDGKGRVGCLDAPHITHGTRLSEGSGAIVMYDRPSLLAWRLVMGACSLITFQPGWAQTDQTGAYDHWLRVISQYEAAFLGKTVRIHVLGLDEHEQPEPRFEYVISISHNGAFQRMLSRADLRRVMTQSGQPVDLGIQFRETCCIPGQRLIAAQRDVAIRDNSVDENETSIGLVGYLDCDLHICDSIGKAGPVFGVSPQDGLLWSTLMQSCKLTITSDTLSGDGVWLFTGRHPQRGIYQFWITKEEPVRILRVRMEKTSKNLRSNGCERPSFTLPPPRAEDDPIASATCVLTLDSLEYETEPTQPNLRRLIMHFDRLDSNGNLLLRTSQQWLIRSVEAFKVAPTDRMQFQHFQVKDGTAVRVSKEPGVRYEFRNGRIERVIDTAGIEEMEGVRFRKPPERRSWTLPLSVALVTVIALWIVVRKRRTGK